MDFLSQLEWRNATKTFDTEKKVSEENLKKILEAIRMAPTSFGLQPIHVYVVNDPEVRAKLREKAWGQSQVGDASHLLVFCARTDLVKRIDKYFEEVSGGDKQKREQMKEYESMMHGFAEGKNEEQARLWANRQAYIALGFALAACAELEIDSCPMEGFDPGSFDEILGLEKHMNSVVLLAVGYRKDDPQYPKFRFSDEDLFTKI